MGDGRVFVFRKEGKGETKEETAWSNVYAFFLLLSIN
jgi:hypothetical protein